MKDVDPDIDWQANVLAGKVLKKSMTLEAATSELDDWQADLAKGVVPGAKGRRKGAKQATKKAAAGKAAAKKGGTKKGAKAKDVKAAITMDDGTNGAGEVDGGNAYRKVDSRSLIVTHALNALLKRGY